MSNPDSEEIRRRMARIRSDLDEDVESVVERAKELADWRNFVRRYPLLCVSAATAIGFLVVPSKLNIMSPDASTLEDLAKRNRLVVRPKTEVRRKSGLLAPIIGMVATAVLRNGMTMAGQHLGTLFTEQNKTEQPISN